MKNLIKAILFIPLLASAANYDRTDNLIVKQTMSVGSNTTPDSKSILDLVSTTKGALLPRMTTAQRDAISSPSTGLMIYNTTTNRPNYYSGSAWREQASLAGTETLTNKTIDGDDNTVQDLPVTSLKTVVGNANKVVTFNGSGVPTAAKVQDGNIDSETATSGYVLTADGAGNANWNASSGGSDQSYELTNLSVACSVGSSALTCALKDKAGSDPSGGSPVYIGFRSSTASSGVYNRRTVSSALSVTASSGSTLGMTSGVADYLYVYAIDNAGTVELAIGSQLRDEGRLLSTTAEGGAGAADNHEVIYSTTARSNVPHRILARVYISEATAGTWNTSPTQIALSPFRHPTFMNSTWMSTSQSALRLEVVNVTCSSSSSINRSTTQTWVTSIDNISAGVCTLTTRTGIFTGDDNPICVVGADSTDASSDPHIVGNTGGGGVNVTIDCSTNTGTDCTSYSANIICVGRSG